MTELPSDPVEFAEATTALLSAEDIEGFLEFLDPAVEFVPLLAGVETTVYRGHDGIREWYADVGYAWAGYRLSLRDFEQVSETVAVIEFGLRLRSRERAVEFESNAFGVTVRDLTSGLLVSWRSFATREEAQAAAAAVG